MNKILIINKLEEIEVRFWGVDQSSKKSAHSHDFGSTLIFQFVIDKSSSSAPLSSTAQK